MCSFGSCKTRFEFLSQFRKVRNAFECFVTQVQTRLPKTKRVWPMKINVICTVHQWGMQTTDLRQCPLLKDVGGGIVGRRINIDNNLIQMKNILQEGYNKMTQSENTAILNAVQLFIENTTRFQR